MLGPALGLVVAYPAGDITAGAGDGADHGADDAGAENGGEGGLYISQRGQDPLQLGVALFTALFALLDVAQPLREGIQRDQGGDHGNTAHEIDGAEGEPGRTGEGVDTDGGHHQTQNGADETLDYVFRGDAGDHAQTEHGQCKILGGAEFQSELAQKRRGPEQHHRTEQATEGRSHGGNTDGPSRLAQTGGHGITVQNRGGGVGCAGRLDQNGGDGAAVDRAAEDAKQHQNTGVALQREGQGHHDAQAHDRGQAGHCAHQNTDQGTKENNADVIGLEHIGQCCHKCFHCVCSFPLKQDALGQGQLQGHGEDDVNRGQNAYGKARQNRKPLFTHQQHHGGYHKGGGDHKAHKIQKGAENRQNCNTDAYTLQLCSRLEGGLSAGLVHQALDEQQDGQKAHQTGQYLGPASGANRGIVAGGQTGGRDEHSHGDRQQHQRDADVILFHVCPP